MVADIQELFDPCIETLPFWNGCRHQQLLLPQCTQCGQLMHPFDRLCSACLGLERKWIRACGTGRVVSWVVYQRAYHPAYAVPYMVALIALSEGPRLIGNLVDCSPDTVTDGMPVTVVFDALSDQIVLPRWRPKNT